MKTFDDQTLRRLEALTLVANDVRVGMMKGDRRSSKRGTSVEFADYRSYVRGDDLRRLDWNVYARLERPFIKLLQEEEDLAVHLLVDCSLSMDWPDETAANKLQYALRLAAALGHIGLASGDLVSVALLDSRGHRGWGPFRGGTNTLHLLQFLESAQAAGTTIINQALSSYAMRSRRPGLLFLISDLLAPDGYRRGLNAIQAAGYEAGLLHVLSPDEVAPALSGDLALVDVETGGDAEVTMDAMTLSEYRQRLEEWRGKIANHCRSRGVHYVPIETDQPWDEIVLQTFRSAGIVK